MGIQHGQLHAPPLTPTGVGIGLVLTLTITVCSTTHADSPLFVSRPGEILKLDDKNGDGDFLDILEVMQYADCSGYDIGTIDAKADRIFVAEIETASILLVEDHNGDGDALDYGEITVFAHLPGGDVPPLPSAIECISAHSLFITDKNNGRLYLVRDINRDGDALDIGEMMLVAEGLTIPTAITLRPDGSVLMVEQYPDSPIRILDDRNADVDFFDFAESLPFTAAILPSQDLVALSMDSAYLSQQNEDAIVRLYDRTGDNDCLDIGEVIIYATDVIAPTFLAADGGGGLFVAASDADFSLFRVLDINGDGDALDSGEVSLVAIGLDNPKGMACLVPPATCIKGDINEDQDVETDDIPGFVAQLLGNSPNTCPADINEDDFVDGRDIQPFVMLLL